MSEIDESILTAMHERAAGDIDIEDLLRGARRQGLRRRRRGVALTSGSCALLAVAAIAVAALAPSSGPGAGRAPAAGASAPSLQLAAAATASQNISYKIKVTCADKTVRPAPTDPAAAGARMPEFWSTTEGAFDPATLTGYLHTPYAEGPGFTDERLIGGVRYVHGVGIDPTVPWQRYPGKQDQLGFDCMGKDGLGASVDPEQLFKSLQQDDAKITQTGSSTYHFEVAVKTDPAVAQNETLVGDVTLNADKRIAKLVYEWTVQWVKLGRAQAPVSILVTMELSDYGVPVTVEQPADVVPAK